MSRHRGLAASPGFSAAAGWHRIARPTGLLAVAAGLAALLFCCTVPTPTLNIDASVDGDQLIVTGTTNLPDGAWIDVRLCNPANGEAIQCLDARPSVQRGSFTASLDLATLPAGDGVVFAWFLADDRQPAVSARFGSDGEGLSGPQRKDNSDGIAFLEDTAEVAIP